MHGLTWRYVPWRDKSIRCHRFQVEFYATESPPCINRSSLGICIYMIKSMKQPLISSFHCVKVCVIVKGHYIVEVRLFGYSIPSGKCQECVNSAGLLRCCDSFETEDCSNDRQCDSYFIYCLRPVNTSSIEEGCSGFENIMSNSNRNDGPVNFQNNIVLGLPNPLLLPGLTDNYTVGEFYFLQLFNLNQLYSVIIIIRRNNHLLFICREFNFMLKSLIMTVLIEMTWWTDS